MIKMKKVIISFAALSILFACSDSSTTVEKKDGDVVSRIASDSKTDTELDAELERIAKEEEKRLTEIEKRATSLEFDRLKHDFGNVGPDSDNITSFEVKNTGNKPLIIDDVSASCGCTMPKKPEGPIAPGETDIIEVKFHPKPGQKNEIIKTVTVKANTVEKIHKLEIRAFVTD